MAKLGFLKTYRPLVRDGKKTATLRRWKRPAVQPGQIVASPGIGTIEVLSVERIVWRELTKADARDDGFASLAALRRAVRRIYPDLGRDGRHWFKIRFRVAALDAAAPVRRARPVKAAAPNGILRARIPSGVMSVDNKLKLALAIRRPPLSGAA